jgi:hypothetical protein
VAPMMITFFAGEECMLRELKNNIKQTQGGCKRNFFCMHLFSCSEGLYSDRFKNINRTTVKGKLREKPSAMAAFFFP